jgi:hypothetical protein
MQLLFSVLLLVVVTKNSFIKNKKSIMIVNKKTHGGGMSTITINSSMVRTTKNQISTSLYCS